MVTCNANLLTQQHFSVLWPIDIEVVKSELNVRDWRSCHVEVKETIVRQVDPLRSPLIGSMAEAPSARATMPSTKHRV